jgi:hypothetical protein
MGGGRNWLRIVPTVRRLYCGPELPVTSSSDLFNFLIKRTSRFLEMCCAKHIYGA